VRAHEGGPERPAEGRQRPLRQGAFRQPEGPAARNPQPAPPPAGIAAAAGAARRLGAADPAQALSAASAPSARLAAAGPWTWSRRAARHRLLADAFGAGDRRGDRQGPRRDRPRRDRAGRGFAPGAASAETAARDPATAVARSHPLGGDAPRRQGAGKFPVKSRKIPCS